MLNLCDCIRITSRLKYVCVFSHFKFRTHRTQVRAVRSYLMEEVITRKLTSTADHLVVTPEEEAADFEACIRANEEWNAAIATERQQRLDRVAAERREFILTRLELKEERDRIALDTAEQVVRREKVRGSRSGYV